MTIVIEALAIDDGQSGLASAYRLRQEGLNPVLMEAGVRTAGSWPSYYDCLTLFSLPGTALYPVDGDPTGYPHRTKSSPVSSGTPPG
jgi:putative flavoprotein involved in K+ transport